MPIFNAMYGFAAWATLFFVMSAAPPTDGQDCSETSTDCINSLNRLEQWWYGGILTNNFYNPDDTECKKLADCQDALLYLEGAMNIAIVSVTDGAQYSVNTCEFNVTKVSCANQNGLKISSASYGRTSAEICKNPDIITTNCGLSSQQTSTLLDTIISWCSGKSECYIPAVHATKYDPCPGTYKYSTVGFACVVPPAEES